MTQTNPSSTIGDELRRKLIEFDNADKSTDEKALAAFQEVERFVEQQTKLARLDSAITLHRNIDVWLNLIERIQPGSPLSPFINAMNLQRVLCDYEADLEAQERRKAA